MATQQYELEGENLDTVKELINKSEALIRYHSKVRTDFLGLEMKIMQERATIEQTMRDTVKGFADELGIEDVESYEVDHNNGTLTLTTKDPEVTEADEADEADTNEAVEE